MICETLLPPLFLLQAAHSRTASTAAPAVFLRISVPIDPSVVTQAVLVVGEVLAKAAQLVGDGLRSGRTR